MNRHFKDSQYYVRRAAATAKHGVIEEIAPIRERVARLRGREEEEETVGRFGTARRRLTAGVKRSRTTGERLATRGRERVRRSRRETAE